MLNYFHYYCIIWRQFELYPPYKQFFVVDGCFRLRQNPIRSCKTISEHSIPSMLPNFCIAAILFCKWRKLASDKLDIDTYTFQSYARIHDCDLYRNLETYDIVSRIETRRNNTSTCNEVWYTRQNKLRGHLYVTSISLTWCFENVIFL